MLIINYLIEQLRNSATYNKSVQVAPAAILWTDIDKQWQPAMPFIKQHLPELIELGDYRPEERIGPAIWVKCAIAGKLEEYTLPEDKTPIIYLPGVGRKELRAIESCPDFLKPLAELQYRGCWWAYNTAGRDWTVASFLTNPKVGIELDLAKDKNTQQAILNVLPDLLETPDANLKGKKLESGDFISLVLDDPTKDILGWLNDPSEKRSQWQDSKMDIFLQSCQSQFSFTPDEKSIPTALKLLCAAEGEWQAVWQRFEDTAGNLPLLVEKLKTVEADGLAVVNPENYLSENIKDEAAIESYFFAIEEKPRDAISQELAALWKEQKVRKNWIWYNLGHCGWLQILEYVTRAIEHTEIVYSGTTPEMMADHYQERFWQADQCVIKAMSLAKDIHQQDVVAKLLGIIYSPWLEQTTLRFQQLVEQHGYPGSKNQVKESTANYSVGGQVVFFVDGLRFDTAKILEEKLNDKGVASELNSKWAAIPSLTATAKAAVTPVANMLTGIEENDDFIPSVSLSKSSFSSHHLKQLLDEKGWQYLDGLETGDPKGFAWVQTGDLDHMGHEQQRKMPLFIDQILDDVVARVTSLFDAGWKQIKIVTDHGWLWVPDGLPKGDLHKSLGKNRQRRCAILKDNVQHDGLVMPWYWNQTVSVAMAPGISAFVKGDHYNHGGLSIQECLTPEINLSITK